MIAALLAVSLGVVGAVFAVAPPAAQAADGGNFDAGFIISDGTFYNSAAMTSSQIQAFLNGKVPNCRATTGPSCLKSYTQATPTMGTDSYCSQYPGSAGESAATIIAKVGIACGINPQVLIVLLQKEQGLVASDSPSSNMYRSATGYGCPDTAACDSTYYGFFNQVYQAARAFQRYTLNPTGYNYRAGRTNQILYNPNAACGTKSVFIQNQATANLYIYTPYTPNSAALANIYGTGDACSSYGNRNFFAYFTDWFGAPGNLLQSASFENNAIAGWTTSNGAINRSVYNDPAFAADGNYYLAMNTPVSGRSITQDVVRTVSVGQLYVVSVAVRASTPTPVTGVLVLWGLGINANENASQTFTATGDAWQTVTVSFTPTAAHSFIRTDIYMTTVNQTLNIDQANLSVGQAPVIRNRLAQPSFETPSTAWSSGFGTINRASYNDPANAEDGKWLAATNTATPGSSFAQDVPITAGNYERDNFSIWLRSTDPTKPFSGTLALWGLGGSGTPSAATPFTVGTSWTKISVGVDLGTSNARTLRTEVYLTTTGVTLWMDNATLARNVVQSGSFEGGAGQNAINWQTDTTGSNFTVYDASASVPAAEGTSYGATNAPATTASLYQDVRIRPTVGDTYVVEEWVRSSDPTRTFTGTLALWALGGTAESAFQDFTAGASWTKVTFTLRLANPGHTSFRLQNYLKTTGNTLLLDGAQVY